MLNVIFLSEKDLNFFVSNCSISYTEGADFILSQVNSLAYLGGETSTDEALRITRVEVLGGQGNRPGITNLVILITDGIPHPVSRREPAIREARLLQNEATVVSVGITSFIDVGLLRLFSSEPREEDKSYFMSPDFETLEQNVLSNLLQEVCPTTVDRKSKIPSHIIAG